MKANIKNTKKITSKNSVKPKKQITNDALREKSNSIVTYKGNDISIDEMAEAFANYSYFFVPLS